MSDRKILASMLPTMIGMAAGIMACALVDRCASPRAEQTTDTVRVVVTDTVRVVQPIARDSVVVRYKTAYLPIGKELGEIGNFQNISLSADASDSVEVVIPITQKVYSDSTYTAWVSGWEPALDSIEVYSRAEYITVTPKPKPWSVGITGGYGITPKGLQPYIGVGVTYTIKTF